MCYIVPHYSLRKYYKRTQLKIRHRTEVLRREVLRTWKEGGNCVRCSPHSWCVVISPSTLRRNYLAFSGAGGGRKGQKRWWRLEAGSKKGRGEGGGEGVFLLNATGATFIGGASFPTLLLSETPFALHSKQVFSLVLALHSCNLARPRSTQFFPLQQRQKGGRSVCVCVASRDAPRQFFSYFDKSTKGESQNSCPPLAYIKQMAI